jgi:hypothetical protein
MEGDPGDGHVLASGVGLAGLLLPILLIILVVVLI